MRRRVILIVAIVVVLGLIGGGICFYVRQNTGWRLLARARVAMNAKRFDRAIEFAERHTQGFPNDWRGYYYQGQAYMGQARYEEARGALDKARQLNPSETDITIMLSRTCSLPVERVLTSSDDIPSLEEAIGGLAKANEVLDAWQESAAEGTPPQKAAELDIKQEKGLNLARVAMAQRRKADLCEKDAEVRRTARDAEQTAQREKEAATARTQAEKAEREALELLKEVVTGDATRDRAGQAAIQLCIAQNDGEALSQIRKVIETLAPKDRPPVSTMLLAMQELRDVSKDPYSDDAAKKLNETAGRLEELMRNLPDDHPNRTSLVLARAQVALMRREPEGVLELCSQVLEKDPRQGQARLYRARALMMQGNLAQSERELFALKTDFPGWEDAQFAYAGAAMRSGKPELAREALRKIVQEIDPRHREALKSLGTYLWVSRFYDQAFVDAQAYYKFYPDDPEALSLLVKTAYRTDQPALARSVLEKATADYPESPEMLLAVADGWDVLGDQGKAGAALRRAADMKPATVGELQAVVLALIRDGRLPEAERTLYDAKTGRPNHPVVHFLLGKLFAATRRPLQAIEAYRRAAALDPTNEAYKVELAWACFGVGDLDGAEEVLRQVQRPAEMAEKLTQEIRLRKGEVADDPTLYRAEEAGVGGAQYYLTIGQPDKCVEICEAELKKATGEAKSNVHRLLGRAYLVQGKRDECVKEWSKALQAKPFDLSIYRDIAAVRSQAEAPQEVEAALAAIPEAERDIIDLTMGWLHDRRRDFATAADCYGKVAERTGATEHVRNSARLLRVQSLANAGRMDDAISEAGKITGVGPWQRQALWTKAQLLLAAKRLPEAESILAELYKTAVESQDQTLLRDLARLYASMRQSDKAAAVCDEILKLLPDDARGYVLRAAVLADAGKLDESVEWYRKAIERQPGDFTSHVSLARIMDQRQDSQQALEVLKQLESMGDAGRATALSERGDMFARWGLPAQAAAAYEELSKLGYGDLPRIKLALGRSFARLDMKERARQILEGIPKYSPEYPVSRQLLAELAETAEKKLEILRRLNVERPGLPATLIQEMGILFNEKRYGEAITAYQDFTDPEGKKRPVPPEASFLALQAMLNAGDSRSAAELSVRMTGSAPSSNWRNVAVLLLLGEEPEKAAKMLPRASEADVVGSLLGIAVARQTGGATGPWADRIGQLDRELAKAQPPRSIPAPYKVLVALANGDTKQAEAEFAQFTGAPTVGRTVAAELISYARSISGTPAEVTGLLRAAVALDLRLAVVARTCALDALNKRPECQWAAALAVQSGPDAATRQRVLEIVRPQDCVVAKIVQAASAADEKNYARTAEIYRSIAEAEKENTEVLARLASAEALAGNLEEAVAVHRKIWQISQDPTAANNAAYLTAHLWPQDGGKLKEAQELIEQASKQAPNLPGFLDTLGWITHLRGDHTRALRLLRQAVKGMPDSIEVHSHLGVVEAAAGNQELARWHLAAAVADAGRLKSEGQELNLEQLQALKLAEKGLSDLGPAGK